MAQLAGLAPRPTWLCTKSVQVGSLGKTHICEGPGASCAPVHLYRVFPRTGSRTTGSKRFLARQTGLPELCRTLPKSAGPPGGGVASLPVAQLVRACRPHGEHPGTWMAWSDLRCFWLQRRRWGASCDMRRERRPPWRLMYATVAVWSVRTSTCLPRNGSFRRLRARRTASNTRQLMCQCSWGPVHTPDTACPLYVAPQPVAEASVKTTACRDTCSRYTPARRN